MKEQIENRIPLQTQLSSFFLQTRGGLTPLDLFPNHQQLLHVSSNGLGILKSMQSLTNAVGSTPCIVQSKE